LKRFRKKLRKLPRLLLSLARSKLELSFSSWQDVAVIASGVNKNNLVLIKIKWAYGTATLSRLRQQYRRESLRGMALGRKNWLFVGYDIGGERAAAMYSLITTAKLNDVNPGECHRDAIARIANGHPVNRIDVLLPWQSNTAQLRPASILNALAAVADSAQKRPSRTLPVKPQPARL
jgi:hypothetical protein